MTQEIEAMTLDQAVESLDDNADDLIGLAEEGDTLEDQETSEETDELEADEESSDSEETEEASEDETENEEEASIETFADLAAALEQSPEELEATLETTIKVNGEESSVTLAELKSGYQREQDYTQKTMAIAEEGRKLRAEHDESIKQTQAQAQMAGAVLQHVESLFAGDQNEIMQLMQTDPQAGLVAKAQYDQRLAQLQQLKHAAATEYEKFHHNNESRTSGDLEARRTTEYQKLIEAIPDLNQEKKSALQSYLVSDAGYSPQELDSAIDHKFYVMAHKAMMYDQKVATSEPAKKRVKTLPKLQSPTKKKVNASRSKFQKASQRLRKTGNINDALAAVSNSPSLDKALGL